LDVKDVARTYLTRQKRPAPLGGVRALRRLARNPRNGAADLTGREPEAARLEHGGDDAQQLNVAVEVEKSARALDGVGVVGRLAVGLDDVRELHFTFSRFHGGAARAVLRLAHGGGLFSLTPTPIRQ